MKGVPTLVLVDASTGHVITNNGREHVLDDPEGKKFPWKPRACADVLSEGSLISSCGRIINYCDLKDIIKGIYFSAHWVSTKVTL